MTGSGLADVAGNRRVLQQGVLWTFFVVLCALAHAEGGVPLKVAALGNGGTLGGEVIANAGDYLPAKFSSTLSTGAYLDHVQVPHKASQVQRCVAILVLERHVSAQLDQDVGSVPAVVVYGAVQRCPAGLVGRIHW